MTIATIIPSLTNAPPSRANPAAFPTNGDAFLNQFDDIVSAQNTVATELNTWNSEIETFKNQASNSQTNAASSSSTTLTQARNAAASMVSLWVSGTTYSAGQIVYSNVDGREYKRKSTGAGATDPSSDTTNWEPLGWEYITNYPDIRPTLDLNFAGSQTVDPRITFTRNSIATYFDKFGVMQTAGINQPRIDFDPVTGECKGLLIEEQRTNLLTYSDQISAAGWLKVDVSVSANVAAAPDGTISAGLLTVTGAQPAVYQPPMLSSATYTLSVYAKAGSAGIVGLRNDAPAQSRAVFDLINGTVTLTPAGTTTSIVHVGNGWYRCSMTFTDAVFNTVLDCGSTVGDSVYLWGAQLEQGSFPTSYIPTTSSAVTRQADNASMTGSNFTSWYTNSGTIFAKYSPLGWYHNLTPPSGSLDLTKRVDNYTSSVLGQCISRLQFFPKQLPPTQITAVKG